MIKRVPESRWKEWRENPLNWGIVMFTILGIFLVLKMGYEIYDAATSAGEPEPPKYITETFESPTTGICYEILHGIELDLVASIDCELINTLEAQDGP